MTTIELKLHIQTLEDEYNSLGRVKPQFLIDNDDEYQNQLELSWYKRDLNDQITDLYCLLENMIVAQK